MPSALVVRGSGENGRKFIRRGTGKHTKSYGKSPFLRAKKNKKHGPSIPLLCGYLSLGYVDLCLPKKRISTNTLGFEY